MEKTELMFNIISSEISYLSRPSDELVKELAKRKELSQLKFLSACEKEMSNGRDFRTAWQRSLQNSLNIGFLNKSDVGILNSFAGSFGTTDNDGQLSSCALYLRLIKDNLSQAKKQREKYASMSSGLGLLAGLAVVVVFI